MITTTALTYALAAIASYSPPVHRPVPFHQGRKLTHRERMLYAEILDAGALGLPRIPRHWQVLAHLVQHRPRYLDAPYEIPHQRRRLQAA